MVLGLGTDLIETGRVEASIKRFGERFLERVYSPEEIAYCQRKKNAAESFAARFAAKEALAKALGAPQGLAWHDAEVVSEESGRPRLELRGTVRARADELGVRHVHVSLSHDAGVASAVVVLEG